jgi:hypothetical protein
MLSSDDAVLPVEEGSPPKVSWTTRVKLIFVLTVQQKIGAYESRSPPKEEEPHLCRKKD